MKRSTFALFFACLMLCVAAQDSYKVNYKGAKPTIKDFAKAYFSQVEVWDDPVEEVGLDEATNAFKNAWMRYYKGLEQPDGDKFIVDEKNGYILYESQDENNLFRAEMCYWNESDGKHKLIAINIACFTNGRHEPGQYDGLSFLRYNNATKRMADCDAPGFRVRYATDNLDYISYSLPRTGKNITETVWLKNGKTSKRVLKWNGRKFSY